MNVIPLCAQNILNISDVHVVLYSNTIMELLFMILINTNEELQIWVIILRKERKA